MLKSGKPNQVIVNKKNEMCEKIEKSIFLVEWWMLEEFKEKSGRKFELHSSLRNGTS